MYSAATRAMCFTRLLLPLGLDHKLDANVSDASAYRSSLVLSIGLAGETLSSWSGDAIESKDSKRVTDSDILRSNCKRA